MIFTYIQQLLNYAEENELIEKCDEVFVRNRIIDALGISVWEQPSAVPSSGDIDKILENILDYACEHSVIEDTSGFRDLLDTRIMGLLTPFPREVIGKFEEELEKSPKRATDWYFELSKRLNYVRAGRIAKDLKWVYKSEYGDIDITINLSKPEKDPRDIAAAGKSVQSGYPKCQLCYENTGYSGHLSHPARQNLVPVPISVNGEDWMFQYSPYGYYNEHCIIFNKKHIPMKIDDTVFEKLFDIVKKLPHYFVGSNADLPIVGGSILSHEHFQGGRYTFAMEKARVEREFSLDGFENVRAGVVKWPMSVIRLVSEDDKELAKACGHILKVWRAYSDPQADIFAETDGTPHNTITPIARRRGAAFECDLVLRNNRTTAERPMGLFHPRPSLHHIKKENIGLIEVMGLAVLPARLKREMKLLSEVMANCDLSAAKEKSELSKHIEWAEEIMRKNTVTPENADEILKEEIGKVFEQVLCDAGVFKRDDNGRAAFERFTETL